MQGEAGVPRGLTGKAAHWGLLAQACRCLSVESRPRHYRGKVLSKTRMPAGSSLSQSLLGSPTFWPPLSLLTSGKRCSLACQFTSHQHP